MQSVQTQIICIKMYVSLIKVIDQIDKNAEVFDCKKSLLLFSYMYVKHPTLLLNRTFFFRSEKLTMLLFCRILCNAYQIFSVTETTKFYRFYIADGGVSNVYKMSANIDKNKSELGKERKKMSLCIEPKKEAKTTEQHQRKSRAAAKF